MSFETAKQMLLRQHFSAVQALQRELGSLPDGLDGLYSLLEQEEDFTCFTVKKLKGRRDKSWGSEAL
ncbi:MAG: hypothetical protein QXP31_02475 [Pyrobaculum sp.]